MWMTPRVIVRKLIRRWSISSNARCCDRHALLMISWFTTMSQKNVSDNGSDWCSDTTIEEDPPITYLLPDLVAAYLTIKYYICIFQAIPYTLKTTIKTRLYCDTYRYLYSATSPILLPQKFHILPFFTPFVKIFSPH